jgi:cob(I)alamin adenosyltransferase
MKTLAEITASLNAIREAVDADIIDSDIVNVQNKLLKLTQLMGLSAETKASAKKLLNMKERIVFEMMDKKMPPSVQSKFLNAECYEENAILEYADRLNAAIVHVIEALRSVISLYKTELSNTLIK